MAYEGGGYGRKGRPGGWSDFTRLYRSGGAAARDVDDFPSLGKALGDGSRRAGSAQETETFAAVAGKGLPAPRQKHYDARKRHEDEEASLDQEAGAAAEAHEAAFANLSLRYPWAEGSLLQDVLAQCGGNEEMGAAYLDSMAETETSHSPPAGTHSPPGEAEPEASQREDVYWKYRREAIRATRASQKLGRGAANAYSAGQHSTAKMLSAETRKQRALAKELNQQAAQCIFREVNPQGQAQLWSLDLHGLHASEAVAAVQARLAEMESLLATNPAAALSPRRVDSDHRPPRQVAAKPRRVPRQLKIITGVGAHSKGGASIPFAVKKFLLDNDYRFEAPRDGVFSVRPKVRY